jgi:predicted DNA-binding transcriptional regulator AlpA
MDAAVSRSSSCDHQHIDTGHGGAVADVLLCEKQAAPILGLSVAWLQRKRWEGGGPPYIKYGRAVRYRKSELLAYIEAHSRRHTSDAGGKA